MMKGTALSLLGVTSALIAQQPQAEVTKTPTTYSPPAVFAAEQPLEITLVAPFRQLKRDRRGSTPYRVGEVRYTGDSGEVRVPVRLRTRGIWRREHCEMPPIWLNFKKDSTKKTEFRHLDRARLVVPCRNDDGNEQYLLREFQLYRVQRLITPLTLASRLVRVTFVDAEKKDTLERRYSFLLEQDQDFAARNGGKALDTKGASAEDLDGEENARFGVFQYFIGNTDFSVSALHNVILLARDTSYYPVAHDFDWSGAVNTRYAVPSPLLRIKRVTERIMRGYCTDPGNFEKAFATFRDKKDAIYALYADSLGALLKPDDVKETLRFFDQFYDIINNASASKHQIVEACLGGRA